MKNILIGLFVTIVGGVILHFIIKNISPKEDTITKVELPPIEQKKTKREVEKVVPEKKRVDENIVVHEGMIGFYKLDGNTNDAIRISKPGINSGAIWTKNRHGIDNRAAAFTGNSYITLNTKFPLKSYTKTAWVQRGIHSQNIDAVGNNILSGDNGKHHKNSDFSGHAFWIPSHNNYKISAGHNDQWYFVSSKEAIKMKEWIFAVVTYEFESYTLKLYLNGELISKNEDVPPLLQCPNLYIGAYAKGNFFNGFIDDVRIYDRALSENEIKTIYLDEK